MKRLLKWLIYCVVALSLCLVVGVVLLQVFYKKEILAEINGALKENFNGDVSVGDYSITVLHNFPNVSIRLKDIYLHGPEYDRYHTPFLQADRIDINVQPFKLLLNRISIKSIDVEDGEISVFRTSTGYSNLNIFKKKPAKSDTAKAKKQLPLDLSALNLQRVLVKYNDSLKRKHYGVQFLNTKNSIDRSDSSLFVHIGGQLEFVGLTFNQRKGSFLKDKRVKADLTVEVDLKMQSVTLEPSSLVFDKSTVRLNGLFQLAQPASFQLDIQSDELDYPEGLTIVADSLAKKLSAYQVDKPVKLRVVLSGSLGNETQPRVDVTFSFKNSPASALKLTMTDMSIDGIFKNHANESLPCSDENSSLTFTNINGKINSLPVKAKATITNLIDPSLDIRATFDIALKTLNEHLDTLKIRMFGGQFISTFQYQGKLKEYLDENSARYAGKLTGVASVKGGHFQYLSRKVKVSDINASFAFNEKRFEISKLDLLMNKSKLSVTGFIQDFIPFFTNPETTSKVTLSITSPKLDVSGLIQQRRASRSRNAKSASKKKVADTMEKLNEELEFDLDFKIAQFINKNFKASNLKGRLLLADNRFSVQKASMDFAHGKVELSLNLGSIQRSISPLTLNAKLKNVALREFFYAFDDFNQKTFRHDQVQGKLNLDLNLKGEVNDKLQFLTHRMDGDANFSIVDGKLQNFEPMQRLSNFLLKGRDFSNVQFGEITSAITMNGTKMDVSRMEIESTVLTMFIEGTYDLKDSSDFSIQVPLSNLKKRDQAFAPENVGVDSKVGPSVFLRVRPDKNGKTAITYDMFKRLRKKKKGANS